MVEILLFVQLVLGSMTLQAKDLLNAVIFLAVSSLINSLLFFIMHAPDVALTEAAVGAGVSTFVFVWVIHKTGRKE